MKTNTCILISFLIGASSLNIQAKDKDQHFKHYISTDYLALAFTTPNIYFERINITEKRSTEVGVSFHSPSNLFTLLFSAINGYGTRTGGGKYGTDTRGTLDYLYWSKHYTTSVVLGKKYYFEQFAGFLEPQLIFAHSELPGELYSHNYDTYDADVSSYWYKADHYSNQLTLLGKFGLSNILKKKKPAMEWSLGIGANFNFDRLELATWGITGNPQNMDPDFQTNFPDYPKTRYTDGFYISAEVRLTLKVGFGI